VSSPAKAGEPILRDEMSMNAVYPHRHHLSAKVRTFIDMLVHHSAEQQKLINPYS
jgi:DNA-binding transcriptional LysR family regulator